MSVTRRETARGRLARGALGSILALVLAFCALGPSTAAVGPDAVVPTDAPAILLPVPGSMDQQEDTLFAWEEVPGAFDYFVQVSEHPNFISTFTASETDNLFWTPDKPLFDGTVYWRVAAREDEGGRGPWAMSSFVHDWGLPIDALAPADGATINPAAPTVFRWTAAPDANDYEVESSPYADFRPPTNVARTTRFTSMSGLDVATSQDLYWRVRARLRNQAIGPWTSPRLVHVRWPESPVLTSPSHGTSSPEPVLDWDPLPHASRYEVQVDDAANFATPIGTTGGTLTRLAIGRPAPGTYWWRVRGINEVGLSRHESAWSAARSFVVPGWSDEPELAAPADGASVLTMSSLEWQPIVGATRYVVHLSQDQTFPEAARCTAYAYSTRLPLVRPCLLDLAAGTWYWRVAGIRPAGLWNQSSVTQLSDWSASRSVRIGDAPPATALFPADGSTVTALVLTWTPVPDTIEYELIFRDRDGVEVHRDSTRWTSYTLAVALPSDRGPYSWVVNTYRTARVTSSAPATFSIDSTAEAPLPTPTLPSAGAASVLPPVMTWTPVIDAASYQVRVCPTDACTWRSLPGVGRAPYAAQIAKQPLAPGPYSWHVEAFAADGSSLGVGPVSDFVIERPDDVILHPPVEDCPQEVMCAPVQNPTLSWDPVAGASYYDVGIYHDAGFTFGGTHRAAAPQLTPDFRGLESVGRANHWYVVACIGWVGTQTNCSDETTAKTNARHWTRATPAPTLAGPDDGAVLTGDIVLRAEDYPSRILAAGAHRAPDGYGFQVASDPSFGPGTILSNGFTQTPEVAIGVALPDGPVYWRMSASDAIDGSAFSAPRMVTKMSDAPTLLWPATDEIVAEPTFAWAAMPGQFGYRLQARRIDGQIVPYIPGVQAGVIPAHTPNQPLVPGDYAWKVAAKVTISGVLGPWSVERRFTVPEPPPLVDPDPDPPTPEGLLDLDWTATSLGETYEVEASTTSTFAAIRERRRVTLSRYAPRESFPPGTYYWRVRTLGPGGETIRVSPAKRLDVTGTDRQAPTGSVRIAAGAEYATSHAVTLDLLASDAASGVVRVFVSNAPPVGGRLQQARTFANAASISWSLSDSAYGGSTTQGARTVYVQWQDAAGNRSTVASDRITVDTLKPTITGPSWAFVVGGMAPPGVEVPGRLTWAGNDVGTGIAGYTLFRAEPSGNTSEFGYDPTTTWLEQRLTPGRYTFRVRARDVAGNIRTTPGSVLSPVDHAETSAAITYRGPWTPPTTTNGARGGKVRAATTSTASATLAFTGSGVAWVAAKGPQNGAAKVYVDGSLVATVDLYASASQPRRVAFARELSYGSHTLKIVPVGTAGRPRIEIDSFFVAAR